MSSTIDLGTYLIVIIIVSGTAMGVYSLSSSILEPRGVSINEFYDANAQYTSARNISEELNTKIRETGIEDESSQSKIISVAWSGLKLFLRLPSISYGFISSIADTLNISVGTVSVGAIIISIFIVAVIWTLINMIVLGGIR